MYNRAINLNHIDSRVVGFMVNDICNMACTYCYQQANNLKEADVIRNERLTDKVVEYTAYLYEKTGIKHHISVEGGEPFFDKHSTEYLLNSIKKKTEEVGDFYDKILLVTNCTKTENMRYIIDTFDFKEMNIVLEVSLHYNQYTPKALTNVVSNIMLFKDNIEYVRILSELNWKELPTKLRLLERMFIDNDIQYFFAPIVGLEEIKEIKNMTGFPFKGEVDVNINGEVKDINFTYHKDLPTLDMVCENNQCFFFFNTGDVKMFSCVNNREVKNIFEDSFDDIFSMNKKTICAINYCMDCNLNNKYEVTDLDLNNPDDFDVFQYYLKLKGNFNP